MPPCITCGDKKNMIEGYFKMRFICGPNGKLLKGAPGNFECGKIYVQPYRLSKFAFWELIEKPPELKIPEDTDNYEEVYFVAQDDEVVPPFDVSGDAYVEKQSDYKWDFSESEEENEEIVEEAESEEDEASRESLIEMLEENGVEYSKHHSTKYLRKLVDAIEKED